MSDLAITARCWEDLAALPVEVAEHILAVFVARRRADPESGETMHGVGGPLRKLHADLSGGRSIRAVTWYDRGRDVCWLLAAGDHTVYGRVEALARTGGHLPTAADVANFDADAAVRLVERVLRHARPALEAALAAPGTEVPVTETPRPGRTSGSMAIGSGCGCCCLSRGAASSASGRSPRSGPAPSAPHN